MLFILFNKAYPLILGNGEIARQVKKPKRQVGGFGFHDFIEIDINCN